MAWVLIDDNFPNHPKVMQAGPMAAWLYVCGVAYCRRYHTGGLIPANAVKTLGVATNPRRLIDALLAVNLWEKDPNGFRVHDYAVMYPDDAGDKAEKEARRRQKQEAGRKGGNASWARRSGQAPAEAEREAQPKQPAPISAEPHRSGCGSEVLVASLQEGKGTGDGDRREPPPLDEWLGELQRTYPKNRVTYGFLTGSAFHQQFLDDPRPPEDVWAEMRCNLAINIRSHEWRVRGMAPKLEKYLREGGWRQQHAEHPPSVVVGEKTARTLIGGAAFVKGA